MAKIKFNTQKKCRTPLFFINHLALLGFSRILKALNEIKDREPMDGDETEAISKELLRLLDKNEGNT